MDIALLFQNWNASLFDKEQPLNALVLLVA
jgi:hypothetical protein